MDNRCVLNYCRSKEALRKVREQTKEERAEQLDATRTLGSLLRDSMMKNEVRSVPIGDNLHVRLTAPVQLPFSCKSVEEVMSLFESLPSFSTSDARDKVEEYMSKWVRAQIQERRPPPGLPRVSIVSRIPRKSKPPTPVPAETRRMIDEYVSAYNDRLETRNKIRPFLEAVKQSERAILPVLGNDVPRVKISQGSKEKVLQIERVEPRPTTNVFFGSRLILSLAKQAATSFEGDWNGPRFKSELERLLLQYEAEQQRSRTNPRIRTRYVKE